MMELEVLTGLKKIGVKIYLYFMHIRSSPMLILPVSSSSISSKILLVTELPGWRPRIVAISSLVIDPGVIES